MRDFYRDTDVASDTRALALLPFNGFAAPHNTMPDALSLEVLEWLDENIRFELEWDVWDRDRLLAQTDFNGAEGRMLLDNYFFIFQFESDVEATMFKLRWPVVHSRPGLV